MALIAELDLQQAQPASTDASIDNSLEGQQQKADIRRWISRITSAKRKWETDFKRMRENMEFASGFQWAGQAKMDDEK